MDVRTACALAVLLASCSNSVPHALEGVFVLPREAEGYQWEALELKDGRFRYWLDGDVVVLDAPDDSPRSGTYRLEGDHVRLDHPSLSRRPWIRSVIYGTEVLLRGETLASWWDRQELSPFGILIRTEGDPEELRREGRPSIAEWEWLALKERQARAYDNRHAAAPPTLRSALRHRSRSDGALEEYRGELERLRRERPRELPSQILACMARGHESRRDAAGLLHDLYEPPVPQDALLHLVDGLRSCTDRHVLEEAAVAFLRGSGKPSIEATIPGTGIVIRLEHTAGAPTRYLSTGYLPGDAEGLKTLAEAIHALQAWMRQHLP